VLVRPYTPGVLVNDVVYQMADGTVDRASATALGTARPLLGVVQAIDSPLLGLCEIMANGDRAGFAGLVAAEMYLLGQAPGSIVGETDTVNPNYPDTTPGSGEVMIEVGVAASGTLLYVRVGDPIVN
jgi:hypothetical protein